MIEIKSGDTWVEIGSGRRIVLTGVVKRSTPARKKNKDVYFRDRGQFRKLSESSLRTRFKRLDQYEIFRARARQKFYEVDVAQAIRTGGISWLQALA